MPVAHPTEYTQLKFCAQSASVRHGGGPASTGAQSRSVQITAPSVPHAHVLQPSPAGHLLPAAHEPPFGRRHVRDASLPVSVTPASLAGITVDAHAPRASEPAIARTTRTRAGRVMMSPHATLSGAEMKRVPSVLTSLALAVALAMVPTVAVAQRRASYFDQPATIRVIGTPRPGEALPLLVVLPPTGGTAAEVFAVLAPHIALAAYVVLLPAGAPLRADYSPDFDRFVAWYDARVSTDLASARAHHAIDAQRIYATGFSLGGDLTWALLARHPEVFRGGFVMGSRCGTSMGSRAMAVLRGRDARIVFAIGRSDSASRVRGLTAAFHSMQRARVTTQWFPFEGAHELPADTRIMAEAFRAMF